MRARDGAIILRAGINLDLGWVGTAGLVTHISGGPVVPASIIEIGMVVGHLLAVQPPDLRIRVARLGVGIGAGIHRRRRADHLEQVAATVADRAVPRLGGSLHPRVIGRDVRRGRLSVM